MLKRMEKVRLYPSRSQERELSLILSVCCDLYNGALEERKQAYARAGISISLTAQRKSLTEIRSEWAWVSGPYQEVEANALRRVDNAFKAFFRRCKAGETPGFPRFRSKRRYDTFEYPHGNRCVYVDNEKSKIRLPSIGMIRFRNGRAIPEAYGRVIITRKAGKWYACFECRRPEAFLPSTGAEIGVDVGIAQFAATSDGHLIANPRHANAARALVEKHQRAIARCKRGSRRRRKAILLLSRAKEHEANCRRDNHHKVARKLIDANDLIAHEELALTNMTRSASGTVENPGKNVAQKAGLNRSILDAGWGQFISIMRAKAEEAGRVVIAVDPKYTSQTCARCEQVDSENRRSQAEFVCQRCGHTDNADVNAARNILKRARNALAAAA